VQYLHPILNHYPIIPQHLTNTPSRTTSHYTSPIHRSGSDVAEAENMPACLTFLASLPYSSPIHQPSIYSYAKRISDGDDDGDGGGKGVGAEEDESDESDEENCNVYDDSDYDYYGANSNSNTTTTTSDNNTPRKEAIKSIPIPTMVLTDHWIANSNPLDVPHTDILAFLTSFHVSLWLHEPFIAGGEFFSHFAVFLLLCFCFVFVFSIRFVLPSLCFTLCISLIYSILSTQSVKGTIFNVAMHLD
jgi:hypothetical protein